MLLRSTAVRTEITTHPCIHPLLSPLSSNVFLSLSYISTLYGNAIMLHSRPLVERRLAYNIASIHHMQAGLSVCAY